MQITVTDVDKSYGSVIALDGLTLEIPADSTFGVLGTNGAGKSTLFKILVGLDQADAGEITIGSHPIKSAGPTLREAIGYLPEQVGFPGTLTGREILKFHADMRGLSAAGRIDMALETVGLDPAAITRSVDGYSNGMRKRLGLATTLVAEPDILLLDEPTAGLDPRGVAEFHRIIDRIRHDTGATVILSSHVLSEIERLCDQVVIMHEGKSLLETAISDLKNQAHVTIFIVPSQSEDQADLLNIGAAVGQVERRNEGVEIYCPVTSVPKAFAAMEGVVKPTSVRIEQKALEEVFHAALAENYAQGVEH